MSLSQSQKRPRSPESCEECLPISKRINRLQIENDRRQSGEEKSINIQSHQAPELGIGHSSGCTQQNLTPCQGCVGNNNLPYDICQGYNPELTDSQNPQYYTINNTLFKAHYDRVVRHKPVMQYPNT